MLLQEGAGGEGQPPSPDECVPASPGQWAGDRRRIINTKGFFFLGPLCKECEFPQTCSPFAAMQCCRPFTQPTW